MFKVAILVMLIVCPVLVSAENDKPIIENVSYEWYLSDESIIEISWSNLWDCSEIFLNNSAIVTESESDEKITYLFSKHDNIKWMIDLRCNLYYASKWFTFPFISSIDGNVDYKTRKYKITWSNFVGWVSVYLESWISISNSQVSTVIITWDVPENASDSNIYVTSNNLKSNLFFTDFNTPYIDYISSENWFKKWETITIYWSNLDYFSRSYIQLWDYKITDFQYDEEKWTITFTIPDTYWLTEIFINSNGIKSNILELDIVWKKPNIERINLSWTKLEKDGKITYEKNLHLVWELFWSKIPNFKVYSNNKEISVISSEDDRIVLEEYDLDIWNNYIYIDINGTHSNIINYYHEVKTPQITLITPLTVTNDLRSFRIWLTDFDRDEDIIYFNNWPLAPYSCLSTSCIVKINSSVLEWVFSVWRWTSYKSSNKKFDISFGKSPIIYDINFYWDLKYLTRFKINWDNLADSSISFSNLVTSDKDKYDLEINNDTIEWKLFIDYNIDSSSSVNITKNWLTSSLNFKWIDVEWGKLDGAWIINEIVSESKYKLFTPWSTVKINWRWFHKNDIIELWWQELNLNFNTSVESSFVIPSNFTEWEHSFNILTSWWQSSAAAKIFIVDNLNPSISFENIDSELNSLYVDAIYTDELIYEFNLNNRISDVNLSKLKFKINNFNNEELWLFALKIDDLLISESLASKDGYISFENIFIDKQWNDYKFSLVKKSIFHESWNYSISIDIVNWNIRWTNIKFDNFDLSDLKPWLMSILAKSINKCVDTSENKENCLWNNPEPTNNTVINDEPKSLSDGSEYISSAQLVYNRIDKITEDYIYKTSKLDIYKQLNTYKDFRLKIKSILLRNKNSPSKKYLDYFYGKIDEKYKKVFKEYVLSKK